MEAVPPLPLTAPCSDGSESPPAPGSTPARPLSVSQPFATLGLGLLRPRSTVLAPPALDLVGYYAPWASRGDPECSGAGGGAAVAEVVEQVPPAVLYPALRGLVNLHALRREDPFSLSLPLTPLASLAGSYSSARPPRSEKKPTPEDQKDQRYLERRRRNNKAAKKSRDARRAREDQVALRAALLEHENAVLRAQLLTVREEAQSLRQLLISPPR